MLHTSRNTDVKGMRNHKGDFFYSMSPLGSVPVPQEGKLLATASITY